MDATVNQKIMDATVKEHSKLLAATCILKSTDRERKYWSLKLKYNPDCPGSMDRPTRLAEYFVKVRTPRFFVGARSIDADRVSLDAVLFYVL